MLWIWQRVLKVMINLVPCPTVLSTLTEPAIYSIRLLQMLSPRPTPNLFLCALASILLKFMKRLWSLSGGIPQPKSWTSNSKLIKYSWLGGANSAVTSLMLDQDNFRYFSGVFCVLARISLRRILMRILLLFSENFKAFDKKLIMICMYRLASPLICEKISFSWADSLG